MENSEDNTNSEVKKLSLENAKLREEINSIKKAKEKSKKRKLWLTKRIGGFFIGSGLKDSLSRLYEELPDRPSKESLVDVSAHLIWRITRISLIALAIALIPTILLFQQNRLINSQNSLFAKQNIRIEQQTELLEADRRSALIFLMNNIFDKVDDELKSKKNEERILSDEIIARIIALSQSLKPYKYLEDQDLIDEPLSPERGHLLLTLANSNLDTITLDKIVKQTHFRQAELRSVNFENATLRGIDLAGADLRDSRMKNVNFGGAIEELVYSTSYSEMTSQKMTNLRKAMLNNCDLSFADLRGAHLGYANFTNASLYNTRLDGSHLEGAILSGIKYNAETDFRLAGLEGALIDHKDWISNLEKLEVKGYYLINENYFIDSIQVEFRGKRYYEIKKKK